MVIMDHKFDGIQVEGQSTPSYLKNGNVIPNNSFQNSTLALSNGISNLGSSIQSIPPQVVLIKDKIINRSYCVINDKNVIVDPQGQVISIPEKDLIKSPKGIKDNETGIDAFTSPTSSRYRSFSAPSAHSLNRKESFQASIDNFVSKFKRSHSTGGNGDSETNSSNSNEEYQENEHECEFEDDDKREMVLSDSEAQYMRKEKKFEKEDIEEMMKKMRSLSLTSLEGYMRNYKSSTSAESSNEMDNYEKISHIEYQERIEREELERIDKNSIIISQSNQDNYRGLDIYDSNYIEHSNSYPSTPKSQSPVPSHVVGSPTGRASPLLKRSFSSQLHLSKSSSSSKINVVSTIQEQEEPTIAVDNSKRLSPRKILPLTKSSSYQSVSSNNNNSNNVDQQNRSSTPIPIISISSPTKEQLSSSPSTSTSTSLNSSTNSMKSISSPKPFKRLTSKLSLSAQSLPKVELNQSQQNIPTTSNNSKTKNNNNNNNNSLVKCPSGTSIEKLKKKSSSNNNNNNNNNLNAFQLELMQHLKSKKEQTTSSS